MVALLRGEAGGNQGMNGSSIQQYARGIRNTYQQQRETYQNTIDKFFKQQMNYLTGASDIKDLSDYEDSIEVFMKSKDTRHLDTSNQGNQDKPNQKS